MWIFERMKDIWKWLNADEGKKALKWFLIGGIAVILYGYFSG
jgi:lipid-A-disaccharide synthase-like uncharacterized protein